MSRLFLSAKTSSLASRARLSMGTRALRRGDGISEGLGEERFQRSGESARGGLSGWRTGLGGEPMIGVDVPGYEREICSPSRSRRVRG